MLVQLRPNLFSTVSYPTGEPLWGTGLALDNKESNGVWRTDEGPCQRDLPNLASTQHADPLNFAQDSFLIELK